MTDRTGFFTHVRTTLARGTLSAAQVAGLTRLLDAFAVRCDLFDPRHQAYILATAWHETGARMQPVTENLNYSARGLIATFPKRFSAAEAKAYAREPERIANRVYAGRMGNGDEASGDGWRYCGRGLVQITGRRNYRSFGIEGAPAKALEPDIAIRILLNGMVSGAFSGARLSDYFRPGREDWVKARAIINGRDKAELVAGYGRVFYEGLGGNAPLPASSLPAQPLRQEPHTTA
jgi:putative chitinase